MILLCAGTQFLKAIVGLQNAAGILDATADTHPRGLWGAAGPPDILSNASIEGPRDLGDVDESTSASSACLQS